MTGRLVIALGLLATPVAAQTDMLQLLEPDKRRAVLSAMLEDQGLQCDSVTRALKMGHAPDGKSYWDIACQGGQSYRMQLENFGAGKAIAFTCAEFEMMAKLMGKPYRCWQQIEAPPSEPTPRKGAPRKM